MARYSSAIAGNVRNSRTFSSGCAKEWLSLTCATDYSYPRAIMGSIWTRYKRAGNFEEIEKSINSARDTQMNHRIRPCQLGVAFCDHPKSSKLLQGIFLLLRGKAFLEIGPALRRLSSCLCQIMQARKGQRS